MRIRTSKNKEFEAVWFGETLDYQFIAGEIYAPLDASFLSDIVDDFDTLDYIDRYDESEGDKRFLVEPMLRAVSWTDRGTIRLEFWGKKE